MQACTWNSLETESAAALAQAKRETGSGTERAVGSARAGDAQQHGRESCREGREITVKLPLFHKQERSCPAVINLCLLLKNLATDYTGTKLTIPRLNSCFFLLQILLVWMVLHNNSSLEKGFPMCCKSFLKRAANVGIVATWSASGVREQVLGASAMSWACAVCIFLHPELKSLPSESCSSLWIFLPHIPLPPGDQLHCELLYTSPVLCF